MNEYTKQANDWATRHGVKFEAKYAGHGRHFPDDTDTRDRYRCTLSRGAFSMTVDFGQSLADSASRTESDGPGGVLTKEGQPSRAQAPDLYSVLAGLQKHDVGTFSDWCSDMGADEDSRKAFATYTACQEEYAAFLKLCRGSDSMLSEAQEIN